MRLVAEVPKKAWALGQCGPGPEAGPVPCPTWPWFRDAAREVVLEGGFTRYVLVRPHWDELSPVFLSWRDQVCRWQRLRFWSRWSLQV